MLQGVYKHRKQPLEFMFSSGQIKSNKLLNNHREHANQATGKQLIVETEQQFKRHGKEKWLLSFLVGNSDVFPLYDPTHLLKG